MFTFAFIIFLILQIFVVRASEKNGVFEKIKSGLQYAKNYLDTAKEIADLVSKSLGHGNKDDTKNTIFNGNNEKRGDEGGKTDRILRDSKTPNLVSGFFRLLGLDSSRIAAIAVNSVIFLAQMISSLFNVKPKIDESKARDFEVPFDPMEFIVENKNERIQNLLRQAQDPSLPDHLIDRLDGLDSACVRLLMCKSSPIILAAQNSLRNGTIEKRFDLTSWLPTIDDFENNADSCEDKHLDCVLFPE